jgi:hypothetical protein
MVTFCRLLLVREEQLGQRVGTEGALVNWWIGLSSRRLSPGPRSPYQKQRQASSRRPSSGGHDTRTHGPLTDRGTGQQYVVDGTVHSRAATSRAERPALAGPSPPSSSRSLVLHSTHACAAPPQAHYRAPATGADCHRCPLCHGHAMTPFLTSPVSVYIVCVGLGDGREKPTKRHSPARLWVWSRAAHLQHLSFAVVSVSFGLGSRPRRAAKPSNAEGL